MCTVSWLHQDGGYQLLCNRDEKRDRPVAAGPRVNAQRGVRYLAPVDGKAGGTWIAANEFGVTVCLLNGATNNVPPRHAPSLSRGLLLPELMAGESIRDVVRRLWEFDLTPFAPFTLAALEPGEHAGIVEWDGREKSIVLSADPFMPLMSSSFDTEAVRAKRRQEWTRRLRATGTVDAATLFSFHGSHSPRPGAYSPCMHRADAETVSFSWVRVTNSVVEFFYTPAAPCQWSPGQSETLVRK